MPSAISPPPSLTLNSLPNEIFVQIFGSLATNYLLPLTTVSHRFYALVLRILHYRLKVAASVQEHQLMLECFHPSAKLTDPLFCKYLGTDGLSGQHEGKGSLYEDVEIAQQLGKLGSVYSRFRPEAKVQERSNGALLVVSSKDKKQMKVAQGIYLEDFENFAQLCVAVNLVKVMPTSRLLLSAVTVEEGVVRLFRSWLKEQRNSFAGQGLPEGIAEASCSKPLSKGSSLPQMLWVDEEKNVGLKLRVKEKPYSRHEPILLGSNEEISVGYEIKIEELHIRATRLLMTLEKSMQEQRRYTKAVIFTRG